MITNNNEAIEKAKEFLTQSLSEFEGKLKIFLYKLKYNEDNETWDITLAFNVKYLLNRSDIYYKKIKLNKEGTILVYEPSGQNIIENA